MMNLLGLGHVWLDAAMLLIVFYIALCKSNMINDVTTFRIGFIIFVLSITAPSIIHLLSGSTGITSSSANDGITAIQLASAAPSVLFSISVLMVFFSLFPNSGRS